MDELVAQTQLYRESIISYVYRITGSLEEAKDITQDTILKYISRSDEEVLNPKAWMFKVATNLTFDFLKSAKNKKETYIGPWLPEPYIEENHSVQEELELDESMSVALLVLLEKLTLKEKIAYVLHDIFDFSHNEISKILNTSIPNSRQLSSRANKKLQKDEVKFVPSKEEHLYLTESFLEAIKNGNFEQLSDLFADEIRLHSDGGGKAIAARKILYGDKEFLTNFLLKVTQPAFVRGVKSSINVSWFNGAYGITLSINEKIVTSYSFAIKDNKITAVYSLRNPDKLRYFNV